MDSIVILLSNSNHRIFSLLIYRGYRHLDYPFLTDKQAGEFINYPRLRDYDVCKHPPLSIPAAETF